MYSKIILSFLSILKIVVLFFLIFKPNTLQSQNSSCGTKLTNDSLRSNPIYLKRFNDNNAKWQTYALSHSTDSSSQRNFPANGVTLPIIIHDVSASNGNFLLPANGSINDYSYIIDRLNTVFTNTGIQFCIAKKDANGDWYELEDSQVIDGTAANVWLGNNISSLLNGASYLQYNPYHYINLFIVDNVNNSEDGFASMPYLAGEGRDYVCIPRNFLQNDANITDNIKVLMHQMGHYLGLYHTYQYTFLHDDGSGNLTCDSNDNCLNDGDMVCDTPPHLNPLETNPPTACDESVNSCTDLPVPTITDGTHFTVETNDPVHNYMNATPYSCRNEFTAGQIKRMQFILDPETGPRNTLLGNSECIDCPNMDECSYDIIPSISLEEPRHYIYTNTTVSFSASTACNSGYTNFNNTWTLTNLATDAIIYQDAASASTSGLVAGNYKLELLVRDAQNNDCFERTYYYFTVIEPLASACQATLPADNANWNPWNRISYTGTVEDTTLDEQGFDIVSVASGTTFTDTNFNVTLPTAANIDRVIRVGRVFDASNPSGGNRYYYSQITIPVTSDNSRFKIWYLGGSNYDGTDTSHAQYGWNCEYSYNSTVNDASSTTHNTTIGSTIVDNTGDTEYTLNDLKSTEVTDTQDNNGFYTMNNWHYKIIDFSAFVAMTPTTEITLTFYARSNQANASLENAYAYFGIECLGGGFPEDFNLETKNIFATCIIANTNAIYQRLTANIPSYFSNGWGGAHNFISNQLYVKVNGQWTAPFSYFYFHLAYNDNTQFFCNLYPNPNDFPDEYADYKIVLHTITGAYEDGFRVFFGFNTIPDTCEGGSVPAPIATTNPAQVVNGLLENDANFAASGDNLHYVMCDGNLPSPLSLTPDCLEGTSSFVSYHWQITGYNLDVVSVVSVRTDTENLPFEVNLGNANFDSYRVRRTVRYLEPYCGSDKDKYPLNYFKLFDLSRLHLIKSAAIPTDVCYNSIIANQENITINVLDAKLYRAGGALSKEAAIPNYSGTADDTNPTIFATNDIKFRLHDPISNQDFGPEISYDFENLVPFTNSEYLYLNKQVRFSSGHLIDGTNYTFEGTEIVQPEGELNFVFKNEDPSNPGSPLFIPTATGLTTYDVDIHIYGTYGGCQVDDISPLTSINMTAAALGGKIDYDCNNDIILNDVSVTSASNDDEYGWQYLDNNGVYIAIPNAPTTASLPILTSYSSLNNAVLPLVIRRVSKGFSTDCPLDDYSNSVTIVFPTFTQVDPICTGDSINLPSTSNEGITGSWSPVINNTTTTEYTFTPDAGQCPQQAKMTVVVKNAPLVDTVNSFENCGSYTLPTLTNGDYYTATNGGGTALHAGDAITSTQTLYIYADNGTCTNESSFTITIKPLPTVDSLSDDSACVSYTLPTLTNGNYYTATNGGGTALHAGDAITSTQTLYIYADDGACTNESSFTITINPLPTVDTLSDDVACVSYTLPTLTNGNYYTATNGGGTALHAGDAITSTQTLYIYADDGACTNESSFTITIKPLPTVDSLSDDAACVSYTLPTLTNGNYYTATNGGGTSLHAGDAITSTQTVYIYADDGTCTNESSFTITINPLPTVDTLSDDAACVSYTLPTLTNGNYYTATNGGGTALHAGDAITSTQMLYIYADDGACANESSFTITINPLPVVDTLSDDAACVSYTLPTLTNGNYYTATNGGGTALQAGDAITSTQTLYIYADDGACTNESSFTITINPLPIVDTLSDDAACVSYILPALTNGNYYTATNGGGTALHAGDAITSTQTLYIYADDGACTNESSFTITINPLPIVDTLSDDAACVSYTLPTLTNGNYYTATNGGGTALHAGDAITSTQTLYIYADDGTCTNESSFSITVNPTPTMDEPSNQTVCNGEETDAVAFTSSVTGTTYSWSNNNTAIGLAASGTGNISAFTATNTTTSPIIATITVTPNANSCGNGEIQTFTITVNPTLTPVFTQIDPIYYGDNLNLPTTSLNGINGTWSPSINNTLTTTYAFTPNTGECVALITMTIEVIQPIDCTLLIQPFDGATDIKIDTYLKWDIVPNASGYYLSIGSYSGANDILNSEDVTGNIYRYAILDYNTTYYVTVIAYDENGEAINCNETSFTTTFKIPKFFTPNNDGVYDCWNIKDNANLVDHIYIFNRFGKVITEILPNDASQWDGRYNGKTLPETDYWYLIQYKNGKQLRGNFSLKE